MKTLITAALGLIALSFTSIGWSTPVYSGNTIANFAPNPGPASGNAAGYYVWSDASHENWSIRWTGNDYGTVHNYSWTGTIELTSLVDGSISNVVFETGGSVSGYVDIFGTDQDFISFDGYATGDWDGFDFSVDTSLTAVVDWELGGSMFAGMTPSAADQAGMGIYIGQNFDTPLVQVQQRQDGAIVQRFETVPEPAALILMAGGLLAVGVARKRRHS